MKTLEWTTVDKSKWDEGPWMNEPDKKQWEDKETGLPCLIVRATYGALCGYVGVPDNHPYYRKDIDDISGLECHGGLSFADGCQKSNPPGEGVCHIPEEGEPDNTWWLGFDCGHFMDLTPLYPIHFEAGETYKTIEYVENQCRDLARQIFTIRQF